MHTIHRFTSRAAKHVPIVSLLAFGLALILTLWIGLRWHLDSEFERGQHRNTLEAVNLSVSVAQSVELIASELDRILLFLRRTRERAPSATWQQLLDDEYAANQHALQIAVADRHGAVLATTIKPTPLKAISLADREHFVHHQQVAGDHLYISKPMIGRASGKWSVQFVRKLFDAQGRFDGIIVVSLDPKVLAATVPPAALGEHGGVALVGDDGIVRAATGRYAGMFSRPLRSSTPQSLNTRRDEAQEIVVASRKLGGLPLEIVVAGTSFEAQPAWQQMRRSRQQVALALTALTLVLMVIAVVAQRRHVRRVDRVARHDALTGLGNRLSFREHIDSAFRELPNRGPFALHLIDLDGFKAVNDNHGHPFGDRVLAQVARRLVDSVRPGDQVVRMGGDEFALLSFGLSHDSSSLVLAERLCKALAEPVVIDGISVMIGASIGIAHADQDATTPSQLVRCADLALYSAKLGGRSAARRYHPGMNQAVVERRELEADLRCALARGEFELHYQPLVNASTRQAVGCEALLRWRHPRRGLVPPLEFIPVAESTGLIESIGDWVIRQACQDAARWGEELRVSVNCSPRQFRSGRLHATVVAELAASGLAAGRLEIEITESMLMERDAQTIQQLIGIRALGVHVALDDFGTGYSSLSYLKDFPVDCIKIDRSFLSGGERDGSLHKIVGAIVAMAKAFDMRTVVEGVEHAWQLEQIAALGGDEVQGYLFARPAPNAETMAWIRRARKAPELKLVDTAAA